jgi:hypothetical protein
MFHLGQNLGLFRLVSAVSAYFGQFRPVYVIRPEYFFGFLYIYIFFSFDLTGPFSSSFFFFLPPSSLYVSDSLYLFFTLFFFCFLVQVRDCREAGDEEKKKTEEMDRYSGREVLKPEMKKKKRQRRNDRRKRRRRKLKKKEKVSKFSEEKCGGE